MARKDPDTLLPGAPRPSTDIPALEFRNVSVSFDDVQALSGISFSLQENEMMVVTGSSGSGKSVLLRLAIGLLRPDEGAVLVRGQEIQNLSEDVLLKIRGSSMGLVFQEDALFSGMTTYENAAYRLLERKHDSVETEKMVREVLRFVGLEEAMDKLPEELSGGMKRRLEIARALVGWPSIALVDEPTAGLDPINARHILNLIIRARDLHRISSLCVSKSLPDILYLEETTASQDSVGVVRMRTTHGEGRRLPVLLLDAGRTALLGTTEDLRHSTLPAALKITRPQQRLEKRDPGRQ